MTKHSNRSRTIALVVTALLLVSAISIVAFTGWPANHFRPPRISQDWLTKEDLNHTEEVSKEFSEILRRDFPLGSSAYALRSNLVEQGFRHSSPHLSDECSAKSCNYADTGDELEYNWGGLPCSQTLRVNWSEDARKRIISVSGRYFASCI